MKHLRLLSILSAAWFSLSAVLQSQPVFNLDPPELINDYISIGEFNNDGDLEGWGQNAAAVTLQVINGELKVTTTSGDPWFFRSGIPDAPPDFATVQVRMRLLKGEHAGWEMFWGQVGAGGFSGGRRIGYTLEFEDNEYHILEFDMSPVLDGNSLTDFRIDPGQTAGNVLDVDYVRVGKISPDTDADGLPDTVETGTGVYVSPRDTGSKADRADTDGDGVSDAIEVTYNTDPNNAASVPVPSIDRYSENPAVYIVGVAIAPNVPTVSNGTPLSFQVTPALPAGLNLSATSGEITGTPTAAKSNTEHAVTATFAGGLNAELPLHIEVRNPYVDFTVPKRAFKKDVGIAPFSPDIHGPAPQSYSVEPALPDGLVLDPATGEISGTPTTYTKPTTYTLSANYAASPKTTTDLELSVLEDPVESLDPAKTVVEYFSVGEFDDPADANAFFRNNIDPLVVDNGIANVVTTGGDPYFGRGDLALDTDYKILEFRVRFADASVPIRLYWSEDAPGRGMSETTAWTLPELAEDNEFHVYQIDFGKATVGMFNAMRIDPGDGAGTSFDVDYIRLGSLEVAPRLRVTRQANGRLRLSWPASVTGTLQSTASVQGGWATDNAAVLTEGNQKFIEVQPAGSARFYRLTN